MNKQIISKKIDKNPIAISKAVSAILGKSHSHVVLHKQKGRFCFTVFWAKNKLEPAEPVATGIKTFRTREECIKTIKKLGDSYPQILDSFMCFDYNLKEVDCKIQYEVKKMI